MKRITNFAILAAAILAAITLAGCGKKPKDPVITAVTPTAMGEISPTDPAQKQTDPSPTVSADEYTVTAHPIPTEGAEGSKQGEDPEGEATPTPADNIATGSEPPENTVTKEAEGQNSSDSEKTESEADPVIAGYWAESFLVWLPRFDGGTFKEFDSDETHDHITIKNVSKKDIERYIAKLTESGFTIDTEYLSKDGSIIEDPDKIKGAFSYRAYNEDGWSAALSYDSKKDTVRISSGYDIIENTDAYDNLRVETPLGLLPEFTYGTFDSSKQEDEMYYAVFSNVSGDYNGYTELLKDAGFTVEADEGDSDGIIWYYAYNEDGYFCEFNYTDGMARIGCGMN